MVGLVSVVVATRNGSRTIEKVLQSILSQTYRPIELVVVDNFSIDSTPEIARWYTEKVFERGPERSAQWNFGARVASGEYLYRAQDDILLPPGLVREAVERIRDGADMVEPSCLPDPAVSLWSRIRRAEWSCYLDRGIHSGPFMRLGMKGVGTSSVMTHLGEPRHLGEVVREAVYYGKLIRRYLGQRGHEGALAMFPFHKSHWYHRENFLGGGPTIVFGFLLYQYVRYAGAIIGALTASERSPEVPWRSGPNRNITSVMKGFSDAHAVRQTSMHPSLRLSASVR